MSGIGAAMIGGSLITGLLSSNAQQNAAKTAADAQMKSNQQALAAQQANYQQGLKFQTDTLGAGNALAGTQQGQLSQLFAPYLQAGQQSLGGLQQYAQGGLNAFNQQQNLTGANGNAAQSNAISAIQNSPMFQALTQQGNDAILQNASATGGLRGGNTQAALAQFSPALLNQLLQQQFQNLGSLSSLGSQSQNSLAALGQGSAGQQGQLGTSILGQQLGLQGNVAGNVAALGGANTSAITGLTNQQGAIGAGLANAQGQAQSNLFGGIGSSINLAALLKSGLLGGKAGNTSGLGASSGGGFNLGNISGGIQGDYGSGFSFLPGVANAKDSVQAGTSQLPLGDLIGSWRF